MPPKRKNDDAGESSARERKKVKVADARTIQVQETPAANGSTPSNNQGNAVASSSAGPSKTVVQFDCACSRASLCLWPTSTYAAMRGLPASIDVERFTEVRFFHPLGTRSLTIVQARAYEIDAMQKSIKRARHVGGLFSVMAL